MSSASVTVEQHFAGTAPAVRALYDRLRKTVDTFGQWSEDPKKTSIHFTRTTAFAGVATRKDALVLTIKANDRIASPRIFKSEQTSANRWHHETRLTRLSDVNRELISWLRDAYDLSA